MGINAIASVGISLVTVGKKDLTNQNEWTESLWIAAHSWIQNYFGEIESHANGYCSTGAAGAMKHWVCQHYIGKNFATIFYGF